MKKAPTKTPVSLSNPMKQAMANAEDLCRLNGSYNMGIEHLIMGFLKEEKQIERFLNEAGVNFNNFRLQCEFAFVTRTGFEKEHKRYYDYNSKTKTYGYLNLPVFENSCDPEMHPPKLAK